MNIRGWWMRFRGMFGAERRDADLAAELESHLQMHVDENLRRGMTAEEARRQALIALGGVEQTKERYREGRGVRWIETFGQDVRFSARVLRKNPGFTVIAVLTLALGIGATTAIFSLVDVVLFRPLPIANAAEVVRITGGDFKDVSKFSSISFPAYLQYRDRTSVFSGVAACVDRLPMNFASSLAGSSRMVTGMVTGNYLATLGVKAEIGRTIVEDDDRTGAANVAMLSDDFWRHDFGTSPSVLGSTAVIDGQAFTIIGVTPAGFGGVTFENLPKVWMSTAAAFQVDPLLRHQMPIGSESFAPFVAVARLKPSVPIQAAQAQIDSLAEELGAGKPVPGEAGFARQWPVLVPAAQEARHEWTRYSYLILGTVMLVLLIACTNASGLLLAHAEGRHKEIAVRSALGATRFRIVRLQLIQSMLVALAGSLFGCFLASAGANVLISVAPVTLPLPPERATSILDGRVLVFAVLAAFASAIVSGLGPALRISRADLIFAMKGEAFAGTFGMRRFSLHNLFVVVQVAASVLLLVGAGLLTRSLWRITQMQLGFDPSYTITASTDPIREGYTGNQAANLLGPLLDALRAQPGVESAAIGTGIPLPLGRGGTVVTIEGRGAIPKREQGMAYTMGSVGYFSTLKIPLLRGRDFRTSDGATAPGVVVINEEAAREFWHGDDALGQRIDVGPRDQPFEIVGIVGNVTTSFSGFRPQPAFFLPLAQGYLLFPFQPDLTLIARGSGDPEALVPALRGALQRVNPNLPLFQVHSMQEQLERANPEQRFLARVLLIFAALATILCAAGIYAQASYATTALTREFGIRLALGAQRREVFQMVLHRGTVLAAAGLVMGFGAAIGLTRVLASMLFEVSPLDATTFAAVGVLFMVVVLLACLVPARRAMRVDPMVALRHE